ncbi:MAG: ATPase P [Anaerolineae bacterium]
MIQIEIPGRRPLDLAHLVLDLNGTVALDGEPIAGVDERLAALSGHLAIHLVTADTHGQADRIGRELGCQLARIGPGHEAEQKQALVKGLGASQVAALGNGANDAGMLSAAALGIAVLGREGLAVEALQAADLVVGDIKDALDLLRYRQRLVATLRR